MDPIDGLYRCVDSFARALVQRGVQHVCLCPGSRSTPLALAFARQPALRLWVHLDERSAAFFALGLAKASRRPVALLCTSGTAAANFLPAVVEAYFSQVPLLVCTADRPPELHHVGANQTIEQRGMYGQHVRLAVDLPVPDSDAATQRYFGLMAGRAVDAASDAPAGPVHLNFPFREPLVPVGPLLPPGDDTTPRSDVLFAHPAPRVPAPQQTVAVADLIRQARYGLIVCGGQDDPAFPEAVLPLAVQTGFPVLADPLSGVRCGPHHCDLVLDSYDAFLRDDCFNQDIAPDLILRFGAAPTSKPLLQYLERQTACPQLLLAGGCWTDPALVAAAALDGDPALCCRRLLEALAGHRPGPCALAWAQCWQRADTVSRAALASGVSATAEPFEGRVFGELARLVPDNALLFAGNSMPVRDLETFYPGGMRRVRFLANRGASGIDGVVSTALGAAAASGRPAVLVIGDLSLYHDMNGLLAARQHGLALTIVLVNNDGGGIFAFLPQASQKEHFERLFGTPHGLDFAPVATLYGAHYVRPDSWEGFGNAVREGIEQGGLRIVEVRTDRAENVRLHRALWHRVAEALRQA